MEQKKSLFYATKWQFYITQEIYVIQEIMSKAEADEIRALKKVLMG